MSDMLSPRTSERDVLHVSVNVADVLSACETQRDYHNARTRYWRSKATSARRRFQKSAKIESVAVTGGVQQIVKSDPQAAQELQLAEGKLANHRAQAESFIEWIAFLNNEKATHVRLTINDAVYFRLSGTVPQG